MLAPECSAREIWRWMKKVWWIVFGCNGLVRSGMQKRSQADRWKTWNFFLDECHTWAAFCLDECRLLCNRTKPYILAKWKYIKQDLIHDLWVEWYWYTDMIKDEFHHQVSRFKKSEFVSCLRRNAEYCGVVTAHAEEDGLSDESSSPDTDEWNARYPCTFSDSDS